ncbi:MAG: hypothetical protein QW328_07755 [Nitrososphaerota archaeon]
MKKIEQTFTRDIERIWGDPDILSRPIYTMDGRGLDLEIYDGSALDKLVFWIYREYGEFISDIHPIRSHSGISRSKLGGIVFEASLYKRFGEEIYSLQLSSSESSYVYSSKSDTGHVELGTSILIQVGDKYYTSWKGIYDPKSDRISPLSKHDDDDSQISHWSPTNRIYKSPLAYELSQHFSEALILWQVRTFEGRNRYMFAWPIRLVYPVEGKGELRFLYGIQIF